MAKSVPASVTPELLKWARKYSSIDIEYAAKQFKIDVNQLSNWEEGRENPTVSQLRQLAKAYHFPIAVFYLPEPPSLKATRPKDRRFLPGFESAESSPELNFEFRKISERREITLELLANLGTPARQFEATTTLRTPPEKLGREIRRILNVSSEESAAWHESRIAFNSWRQKIEALNVLVFQTSDIPIHQMRGFSIYHDIFPVIAINRKDAHTARNFTLIHELVHLMLRTESLCDMKEGESHLNKFDQRIEIFCNSVAACVLVPSDELLSDSRLEYTTNLNATGEMAIKDISHRFCVSKEVIVRRMLTLGLVNEDFYIEKRAQYQKELSEKHPQKGGFVHPVTNVLSCAGKPFVALALENFNRGNITTSDISDYLGVKLKHLDKLQISVFGA